jgi:hypothetical protein
MAIASAASRRHARMFHQGRCARSSRRRWSTSLWWRSTLPIGFAGSLQVGVAHRQDGLGELRQSRRRFNYRKLRHRCRAAGTGSVSRCHAMQKRLTNAASNAIKTFASRRLLRDGVNGGDKSERNREQLNATQDRSRPSRGVHASAVLAAVEGLARGRPVRADSASDRRTSTRSSRGGSSTPAESGG